MNTESLDQIKKKIADLEVSRRELIAGAIGLVGGAAVTAVGIEVVGDKTPEDNETERALKIARGIDISYPQGSAELYEHMRHDFVIIGVNAGIPIEPNPHLAEQLRVASDITQDADPEKTGIAPLQLYLNTANPADHIDDIFTWPEEPDSEIEDNPYGACDGTDSQACIYTYGWQRARESVEMFYEAAREAGVSEDLAAHVVWLDIEEMNSWQKDQDNNRVVLEGMVAFLQSQGANVGIYSVRSHWDTIIGDTVGKDSNLYDLPSWIAKGTISEEEAIDILSEGDETPFTPGGRVAIIQRVEGESAEHPDALDYNYALIDN